MVPSGEVGSGSFVIVTAGRPTERALSYELQRLRVSLEAPEFRRQTLSEVDWNTLRLVGGSALLGGTRGALVALPEWNTASLSTERVTDLDPGRLRADHEMLLNHSRRI
jgi:hypothetical protein